MNIAILGGYGNAGRLIARYLGSSLYTWTSVIGVVLAGITLGNTIGGRLADRVPSRKALSALFAAASITCVLTVVLNNLVGEWRWLWQFNWPLRVFLHVSLVFLLLSSELLVWAVINIAQEIGVSELLIGLTVIAVGTSLLASRRSSMTLMKLLLALVPGNQFDSLRQIDQSER